MRKIPYCKNCIYFLGKGRCFFGNYPHIVPDFWCIKGEPGTPENCFKIIEKYDPKYTIYCNANGRAVSTGSIERWAKVLLEREAGKQCL